MFTTEHKTREEGLTLAEFLVYMAPSHEGLENLLKNYIVTPCTTCGPEDRFYYQGKLIGCPGWRVDRVQPH